MMSLWSKLEERTLSLEATRKRSTDVHFAMTRSYMSTARRPRKEGPAMQQPAVRIVKYPYLPISKSVHAYGHTLRVVCTENCSRASSTHADQRTARRFNMCA